MLINSIEKFTKNLRWRTHFYLKPPTTTMNINTYGFRSLNAPKPLLELKPFEDELICLAKDVQYDDYLNPLQIQMQDIKANINSEPKVIIPADKTTNFYKMEPDEYTKLLDKNIQKEYKKENIQVVSKVQKTHKKSPINWTLKTGSTEQLSVRRL